MGGTVVPGGSRHTSSTRLMTPDSIISRRRAIVRDFEAEGRWSRPVSAAAYAGVAASLHIDEREWVERFDCIEADSTAQKRAVTG